MVCVTILQLANLSKLLRLKNTRFKIDLLFILLDKFSSLQEMPQLSIDHSNVHNVSFQ